MHPFFCFNCGSPFHPGTHQRCPNCGIIIDGTQLIQARFAKLISEHQIFLKRLLDIIPSEPDIESKYPVLKILKHQISVAAKLLTHLNYSISRSPSSDFLVSEAEAVLRDLSTLVVEFMHEKNERDFRLHEASHYEFQSSISGFNTDLLKQNDLFIQNIKELDALLQQIQVMSQTSSGAMYSDIPKSSSKMGHTSHPSAFENYLKARNEYTSPAAQSDLYQSYSARKYIDSPSPKTHTFSTPSPASESGETHSDIPKSSSKMEHTSYPSAFENYLKAGNEYTSPAAQSDLYQSYSARKYTDSPSPQAPSFLTHPPAAESPKHSRPAKKGPLRKAAEFLSDLIRNGEKKEAASPPSTVMHKIDFEIDKSHSMLDLPIPEPKSQLDEVEFRVVAPKALTRGSSALVKFMMYSPDEYEKADRIAKYIADQVAQNVSGEAELERGTTLRICLQSKDVDVEDDSREIVWNGRLSSCDFKVTVPETFSGKQIELTARVYNGLAVLTDLKLILNATGETVSPPAEKCRLKSAFLSYSSNDRSRVIACMRGMLLARSDMDIFIDVIKLRRGEHWEERLYHEIDQRDLFYLFWSRSAAKSEWVKRELEYALKTKGADAVEPVPLELPEVCPPPAALNDRHFNDWMLLYELQCRASENQKPVQE